MIVSALFIVLGNGVIHAGTLPECRVTSARLAVSDPEDPFGLSRYRSENARVKAAVVFMGDSITEMWPVQDPVLFESPGFVNRGISGQTTAQMLVRFRQDVLDLHPEIVVIMGGTNDLAGNFGESGVASIIGNIRSMVELATVGGIRTVLLSTPPADTFPWRPDIAPAADIRRLNTALEDLARETGAGFVDIHSLLADGEGGLRSEFTADGVHLTTKGYRHIRDAVIAAIERASHAN